MEFTSDCGPEDEKAVAVLCAYGIREDGKKVLLYLAVGDKESTVCWKSFFQDMKQRGLVEPLLVILEREQRIAQSRAGVFC